MTKAYYLIFMLSCFSLHVKSQATDLLANGRIWNLYNVGKADYYGYMCIDGDTVVGGKPCKILWQHWKDNVITDGKTYVYRCMYQEGKRVYSYDSQNSCFYLLYDYGANIGDTVRWGREPCDTLVVTAVDSVCLRERYLRRVTFLNVSKEKDPYSYETHDGYVGQWIEGIGGKDGVDSRPYESDSYFLRLKDCREGEDVTCDSRLFSEEAGRYSLRMLSYNPVWSFSIMGGKGISSPRSETIIRKEVKMLSNGGMGMRGYIPHVILNVRTVAGNETEESDHELPLYEEGGRVFIAEDNFDRYLSDTHPEIGSPYKTREGRVAYYHLLLYDFTLGVGDRYPCTGEVYVRETGTLTTRDGISRRTLLLSNGLVIVEGIGCINSPFGLIAYQNTEEGQALDAKGTLASFGYVNKDGGVDTIYESGDAFLDDILLPWQRPFSPGAVHDLQGRRIIGVPQKGVYIQNGRKYVK